jgi:putative membrane protein
MLKFMVVVWISLAIAFGITAAVVPSVHVDGGVLTLLGLAALFGVVNAIVGPLLRLLSLPLMPITFGLFALVINAVLLVITAALVDTLDVGGFLSAVVAAFLISVISAALSWGAMRILEPPPRGGGAEPSGPATA